MTRGSQRISRGANIYIFYILVSEEKNRTLKMQGPFIHRKPKEKESDEKLKFIFKKNEYDKEKRFLSKWLREREPNKTSLFHSIEASDLDVASIKCGCGNTFNTRLIKGEVRCPTCSELITIPSRDHVLDERRQSAMFKAYDYFEKKFSRMEANYKICMRKR